MAMAVTGKCENFYKEKVNFYNTCVSIAFYIEAMVDMDMDLDHITVKEGIKSYVFTTVVDTI